MRAIEYRAWYKPDKKMYPVTELRFDPISGHLYGVSMSTFVSIIGIEYVELMQYTGLRDAAGKKIFEGDLVMKHNNTVPYVIEWSDDGYCTRNVMSKIAICGIDNEHIEIIGNIYEHPHLLEVK